MSLKKHINEQNHEPLWIGRSGCTNKEKMMDNIIKDYKENVVVDRDHPIGNGRQVLLSFDNGYGASLVQFKGSYGGDRGLYEIAVVKFESDDLEKYGIVYDTPVTDDVLGYLSESDCVETFEKIKAI